MFVPLAERTAEAPQTASVILAPTLDRVAGMDWQTIDKSREALEFLAKIDHELPLVQSARPRILYRGQEWRRPAQRDCRILWPYDWRGLFHGFTAPSHEWPFRQRRRRHVITRLFPKLRPQLPVLFMTAMPITLSSSPGRNSAIAC